MAARCTGSPTNSLRGWLADANVRLRALRALITEAAAEIEHIVVNGERVRRSTRANARMAAAYAVHECRLLIADLM
jgi:3-hydroxy-9,10-secoandrosta-1,3,5(10)-triene-9,17-dione monooxygenase